MSRREIEPHFLLLKYPVWYVIALDGLRDAPRTFRCDRILESRVMDASFRLLPKATFDSVLAGNELLV